MKYLPGEHDDLMISRRRLLVSGSSFAVAFAAGLSLRSGANTAPEPVTPPIVGWNAGLESLTRALMNAIIPEDETPGALAVGGPAFLAVVLRDLFAPAERDAFLGGLKALDVTLREQGGAPFASLPAERQTDELTRFDAEIYASLANGLRPAVAQSSYLQLKEITLVAFFTSQRVATTMLDFSPVPGHYVPDLPITAQPLTDYEDSGAYGEHRYAGKLR